MKSECIHQLQQLTGKEYIIFTRRGNSSIKAALEAVKELGREIVLIQDQGGWMTYEEFIEKSKLHCLILKTKYGLVNPHHLSLHHDAVLLINSMAGYSFLEDMLSIDIEAEQNNIFIINDVSGSIGREEAKIGDIIIGSFGKGKPINLGEGGFIATNDENIHSILTNIVSYTPTYFDELETRLGELKKRLEFLNEKRDEILAKLKDYDVIFPDAQGINIIVRFKTDDEKQKIIDFCRAENLEYTECPRYIRVNENAISIELKRL